MYDFFDRQRHYKKLSLIFYGLFLAVIAFHMAILFVLCFIWVSVASGDDVLSYWVASIVFLMVYLGVSIAIQYFRSRQGGVVLAQKMGAVRLFVDKSSDAFDAILVDNEHNDNNDNDESKISYYSNYIKVKHHQDLPSGYARFYEFSEQMSIASGVPMPRLYVLPHERGINAFVAGFDSGDMVLVLTQGAIDTLDNDSLYGLIGHEYGHIIHGDANFNLKIYVLLAGLSLFYEMAEWQERAIFGDFSADYHEKQHPLTKHQWLAQKRTTVNQDPDAGSVWSAMIVAVVLVILRLIGLLGMASHDWLISRFNKQRELLADATSIQLTRSFGVLDLLKTLNKGTATTVIGNGGRHMGYFFFATSQSDDALFSTHPSFKARIEAIYNCKYQSFAKSVASPYNDQLLNDLHKKLHAYQPIKSIDEELAEPDSAEDSQDNKTTKPPDVIAFEGVADKIIKGRLVVDEAWYDWGFDEGDKIYYPNNNSLLLKEFINIERLKEFWDNKGFYKNHLNNVSVAQLAIQPSEQSTHLPLPTPFLPMHCFLLDVPWTMQKYDRSVKGLLILIECVHLCRYNKIAGECFDFWQIYIDVAEHCPNKQEKQRVQILPHKLDGELLSVVAGIDRVVDGAILVKLIQALSHKIPQINKDDKRHLNQYKNGLLQLIKLQLAQPISLGGVKDYATLTQQLPKFANAGVLANVFKSLFLNQLPDEVLRVCDEIREQLGLSDFSEAMAMMVLLLAFFAGVQDNSMLSERAMDKSVNALMRWCQLVQIDLADLMAEQTLINLIKNTQGLNVGQWVACLMTLKATPKTNTSNNKNTITQTLKTALLLDGHVSQLEYDILMLIDELLSC